MTTAEEKNEYLVVGKKEGKVYAVDVDMLTYEDYKSMTMCKTQDLWCYRIEDGTATMDGETLD